MGTGASTHTLTPGPTRPAGVFGGFPTRARLIADPDCGRILSLGVRIAQPVSALTARGVSPGRICHGSHCGTFYTVGLFRETFLNQRKQ